MSYTSSSSFFGTHWTCKRTFPTSHGIAIAVVAYWRNADASRALRATLGVGEPYPPPYDDWDGPTNEGPGPAASPAFLPPQSSFFTVFVLALAVPLSRDELLKVPDDDKFGDADWGVKDQDVLGFVYRSLRDAGLGSDDICFCRGRGRFYVCFVFGHAAQGKLKAKV